MSLKFYIYVYFLTKLRKLSLPTITVKCVPIHLKNFTNLPIFFITNSSNWCSLTWICNHFLTLINYSYWFLSNNKYNFRRKKKTTRWRLRKYRFNRAKVLGHNKLKKYLFKKSYLVSVAKLFRTKLNYIDDHYLYFYNLLSDHVTIQNRLTCIFLDYNYFLQIYFFKVLKLSFNFNFINLSHLIPLNLLHTFTHLFSKITPKKLKLYYFVEISEIFISALLSKNIFFISQWIKKLIERNSIKMFSAIRKYIRLIFNSILWTYRTELNLRGFSLRFIGKFLKGGGKKKK